jgi:hypothetical protein
LTSADWDDGKQLSSKSIFVKDPNGYDVEILEQ